MKLANMFLITALVGVLSAIGCDSSGGGTAGSGGSGTAGTGGSGGVVPSTCDDATCRCGQADSPCAIECSAGDCSQECDGQGVVCAVKCTGADCNQECDGGARCAFTCEGGGCTQECEGDAAYCQTSCSGGNCTGSGAGGTGGSGGSAGSGGSDGSVCPADADELCANCQGQQLNDCEADVFACNTFGEILGIEVCEVCIERSNPGCP